MMKKNILWPDRTSVKLLSLCKFGASLEKFEGPKITILGGVKTEHFYFFPITILGQMITDKFYRRPAYGTVISTGPWLYKTLLQPGTSYSAPPTLGTWPNWRTIWFNWFPYAHWTDNTDNLHRNEPPRGLTREQPINFPPARLLARLRVWVRRAKTNVYNKALIRHNALHGAPLLHMGARFPAPKAPDWERRLRARLL